MSWYPFFNQGPAPAAPGRSTAVDELLRAFPGCRPLNTERSVLDLPIEIQPGKQTALRITLPPMYPQERPALIVLAPVQNPIVDATGRVRCRALDDWNAAVPGKASLVVAVQEALGLLVQRGTQAPPSYSHGSLGPVYQPSPPALGSGPDMGMNLPFLSPANTMLRPSGQQPPARVDLDSLPISELERLLTDDDAMMKFTAEWVKSTQAAQALEEVQQQNVALAQENLSMQHDLDEARNHVAVVRSSEYATLKSHFDELYRRQEAVLAKLSSTVLMEKLQTRVDELDAVSAASEDAFLTAQMPTDQFVEQYVKQRMDFHRLDTMRQALGQRPGQW